MKNINEFDRKKYREFYSMIEFVNSIKNKLSVWSWGARGWTKMNPMLLRFRVSARRFKGYIYIAVNGADLFDIWLCKLNGDVVKSFTDTYIEDLISVIDNEIEYVKEYVR